MTFYNDVIVFYNIFYEQLSQYSVQMHTYFIMSAMLFII